MPIDVSGDCGDQYVYSICTLVTRPDEYQQMVDSFRAKGFDGPDCEYLYIDNSQENRLDAFAGYNRFLLRARGTYVILCHQDIVLLQDGRARLDELLHSLTSHDPNWGVCGNGGAKTDGSQALRISDPWGEDVSDGGPFPARVMSLDENFIVARRVANLSLSHDIAGYHWYGSDLCIIADILGWSSYVIDFHLRHKSGGNVDEVVFAIRESIKKKYRRAFRSRTHYAITKTSFFLSDSLAKRLYNKVQRKIQKRG